MPSPPPRAKPASKFARKAPVEKIVVKNGRAAGVVLQSGEEISANVVSSSVDPHLTFEKFLEPSELPSDFLEGVRRYKFRGSSGKVNIALDALPDFKCHARRRRASARRNFHFAQHRIHGARLRRRQVRPIFSRRPYIDMVIPSLTDPSVAPPGKHVLSCFVQYAPYKLAQGTWDDQREAFGDTVIDTIAEHAPNIKKIIVGRQILTPLDLEREFGLTQGNIFQGELSLEQLIFSAPRPRLGLLPHPDRQPLYVRLCHASRRRHHGRARPHRQPGHSQGMEKGSVAARARAVRKRRLNPPRQRPRSAKENN